MNGENMNKKLTGSEDERAVSPVIGVILMVAITVILAAVIAAFVLDIGPGAQSINAQASISGDQSEEVTIDIDNAGNADNIVLVAAGTGTVVDDENVDNGVDPESESANTGASYTVYGQDAEEEDGTSLTGDAFLDAAGQFENAEYEVWAIGGDLDAGQTLDDADGSLEIGEFELVDPDPDS